MSRFTLCLAVVCLITGAIPAQQFIAADPFSGAMAVYNTTGTATLGTTLQTAAGGMVGGINAIAKNPIDGRVYVAGDFGSGGAASRRLGLLGPFGNPTTDIHVIGDLGDFVSGLTFDSLGTLYAVTGDGAMVPEFLHTVNTETAVMTPLYALGNGNAGEAIGYNPVDGLIYHASGANGGEVWETIDPDTGVINNIGFIAPQFNDESLQGLVWDTANNIFIAIDRDGEMMTVSTTGLKSPLATVQQYRGYALVDLTTFPGTPDDLTSFYAVNGSGFETVGYGGTVVGLNGGDAITIRHDSPGGMQHFNGAALVFGSLVMTANAPTIPEPFPGIHLDFPGLFAIYGGVVNGLPLELPPGGINYGFVYNGLLSGTSVMIQAAISTAASVNGIFASTHGLQVDFL